MKTSLVHRVDYDEFDRLVREHFGRTDFEFVADEECSNDSSKTYNGLRKKPWGSDTMDQWDQPKLEKFKAGAHESYMARLLLRDMVNRDILPEGDYLIEVSW